VLHDADILEAIRREGEHLALVLWPGVQYRTGQAFDLFAIALATRRAGAVFGVDLAHSIGNLPLALHQWGVDFAAGAATSTSMPVPARSAARSYISVTRTTRSNCVCWLVGTERATRFKMPREFLARPARPAGK